MNSTAVSEELQQAVRPAGIDASQCLKDFADYLTRVQGLAPRMRLSYCFWVTGHTSEVMTSQAVATVPQGGGFRVHSIK
jgi:hypothetical protein